VDETLLDELEKEGFFKVWLNIKGRVTALGCVFVQAARTSVLERGRRGALRIEIWRQSFFRLNSSIKRTRGCVPFRYSLGEPASTIVFTAASPA
jgi:hypothetical protein